MSLSEIKQNIDNFNLKDKDILIGYIHELLMAEKRQNNKIVSLNTQLKYLKRHLKKIRDVIDKTLHIHIRDEGSWQETKK